MLLQIAGDVFQILRTDTPQNAPPKSATCFRQLKLPSSGYESAHVMKEKIELALSNLDAGFAFT
jgi:hypothetical protein